LASCGQQSTRQDLKPSEVYQEYHAAVAGGISFEDDASYYSRSKRAEVKDKMDAMVRSSTQSPDQITAMYLDMNQQAAKCSELILSAEEIDENRAIIVFDRKNVCGDGEIKLAGEEVTMVYEKGWKIHDSLSRY
jgi:hypothetical protein